MLKNKFNYSKMQFLNRWIVSVITVFLMAACGGGDSGGSGGGVENQTISGTSTSLPNANEIESVVQPVMQISDSSVWEYKLAQGGRVLNYGRWYNYKQTDELCASGVGFGLGALSPASCWNFLTGQSGPKTDEWVVSEGPWWIDPNHQQLPGGDGFGMINVIGFMRIPSAINSAADLTNAEISFDTVTYPGFSTVTAPSKLGVQKSHIWLWFQTAPRIQLNCTPNSETGENCTRQSDYILTGDLSAAYQIEGSPNGKAIPRNFIIDPSRSGDWTCLGAGLNVKYDCMPFADAVKQIEVVGFIAGPVLTCPQKIIAEQPICDMDAVRTDVARYFNVGQIAFRNLNIKQSYKRQTAFYKLVWEPIPDGAISTLDGWSPITYAEKIKFMPGNGLRLQPTDGHNRFGVSKINTTQNFALVGPQVYLLNEEPVQGLGGGQIRVVSKDVDGLYTVDRFVATYNQGDDVDLLFTPEALAVLKNGEVVHRFPISCITECSYYPFASKLQGNKGMLPLRY